MTRRLLSTRRLVPLDQLEDYLADWNRVRAAAEAVGGRAWLFRGAGHEDHFIEFIEWGDDPEIMPVPEFDDVASARLHLDHAYGKGHADDWEEAPTVREMP
ncbi:MAG: hypothetical protein ACREMQ_14890 [Longimicrobiales bacterium]